MKKKPEELFNIEIKAKCNDFELIRTVLKQLDAEFIGVDYQTDTYFNIRTGRLKLREGNIENCLIYYQRANDSQPKKSDVILYRSTEAEVLKNILISSLGVLVQVKKKREIYFSENVKIHLDFIEGLGSFVEIEAIRSEKANTLKELEVQCKHFIDIFKISNEDMIALSYSDLLLQK